MSNKLKQLRYRKRQARLLAHLEEIARLAALYVTAKDSDQYEMLIGLAPAEKVFYEQLAAELEGLKVFQEARERARGRIDRLGR